MNSATGSHECTFDFNKALVLSQHWSSCHNVLENLDLQTLDGIIFQLEHFISLSWFGSTTNWLAANLQHFWNWMIKNNDTCNNGIA